MKKYCPILLKPDQEKQEPDSARVVEIQQAEIDNISRSADVSKIVIDGPMDHNCGYTELL